MSEKRKRIIQALTDEPLTWNQLIEATGLSKATLSRHLNRLMSDGFVHRQPVLYFLSASIKVKSPLEEVKVYLVKDAKRIKSSGKDDKVKLIPLFKKKKRKEKRWEKNPDTGN